MNTLDMLELNKLDLDNQNIQIFIEILSAIQLPISIFCTANLKKLIIWKLGVLTVRIGKNQTGSNTDSIL